MARKPRIEYAGAVYHVMSRGDRKNLIFRTDRDREVFLDTLGEACRRQGWLVHAFVLLDNHYHLLLETPEPNLVVGMKWLQGTYTQRFNSRHKEWGHLFQGRYKALVIQADRGDYFSTVANYIHLNPVRAQLLDFETHRLDGYPWSSFPLYQNPPKRPEWLCVDRLLGNFQWLDDKRGRSAYREMMDRRTVEIARCNDPADFDERWAGIRRGWYLGDLGFRKEMESLVDKRISSYDRRSYLGVEARLHDESEAKRLLEYGLKTLHLTEAELQGLKKKDLRKKGIAWLIREHTSVKNDWICSHLAMGCSSNLAAHIAQVRKSNKTEVVEMRKALKKAF